jgi:hypothetical protein
LRLTLRLAPGAVARLTFALSMAAAAQTEDELIEKAH